MRDANFVVTSSACKGLRASCLLLLLAGVAHSQSTETSKLIGSQVLSGDRFGHGVAIGGSFAFVGAPEDDGSGPDAGAVYVYDRRVSPWQEKVILRPPVGEGGYFGLPLSFMEDTLAVGAPFDDAGGADAGAVYIFDHANGVWTQSATLVPFDAAIEGWFGNSVSLSGSTLAVGSPGTNSGGAHSGSVYIYENMAGVGWIFTQKLMSSTASANDNFGGFLSINDEGDMLLASSVSDDVWGFDSGSMFLFAKTAGIWSEVAHLGASSASSQDEMGFGIAWGDGFFVLGAHLDDIAGPNTGAAFVFEEVAGQWTEVAVLTPPNPASNSKFGVSCAVSGDHIYVGAIDAPGASSGSGSVHEFVNVSGTWSFSRQLWASDGVTGDRFAMWDSLAVDGTSLLAGAYRHDSSGVASGAAYVFELAPPSVDDVTSMCFCDDANVAPCGNNDPFAGCENVYGEGGLLSGAGSTSVSADDLLLTVSQILPNQFGIFFMGAQPASVPFGDGQLCILQGGGNLIYRYNPPLSSGMGGSYTMGPGIAAASVAIGAGGTILPGSTWLFQGWYRDPVGPCGSGFNLTNAVEVTFQP